MGPPDSETVVEKNSSTSVEAKEQLVSGKDHKIHTTSVPGESSLKSQKGSQEAGFMVKGGEQQFGYQPNVYASQPHTLFSGGYLNHLGQWEEYPHDVSADGLDAASPSPPMYGAYSSLPTIGDSPPYFPLQYPFSSPYYQPPGSPSIGYSNSATGTSQFDPMYQYYLPDGLLFPQTPGFYQPFGSFDDAPMQPSSNSGNFRQGNIQMASGTHQESIYGSGSYKAHQGAKFGVARSRCGFSTFSKGSKHEKAPLHFLNEQNCGPRATKAKNEVEDSSADDKNRKTSIIDEQYNHPDFVIEYKDIKFFVIKSYTEDHIHKSLKYGVWASTATGNRKLNAAYHDAKEKEEPCPIFLFFSVNGSGQFCGVAEMIGPVDFDKSVDYWQNDRWSGHFPVKWHIVKDVPNNLVRHIILGNNENKPVTNSRDTQEVKLEQGLQMLAIFKNHEAETTILEDFDFYEQREKAMLESRQQQKLQCADVETKKLVEAASSVDLMAHVSATFERTVRLDETKITENSLETEATPVVTEEAMLKSTEVDSLSKGSR
ncbi:hypothetical protein ACP4OV_026449 [Aristida adscensionis]